jgi:hypothetical protein
VPWAGAGLLPGAGVGVAEDRGALGADADDDVEEDRAPWSPVAVALDGELRPVVAAGALVAGDDEAGDDEAGDDGAGDDGVDGVVSRCEDALVSASMVVVPEECEFPTRADTGFCPMSSMPVTMPMATTKTATA